MALATLNGSPVRDDTSGSGQRPLLTNGSWTDASSWAGVLPLLTEWFDVVTWDRRSHSRSLGGDGRRRLQ